MEHLKADGRNPVAPAHCHHLSGAGPVKGAISAAFEDNPGSLGVSRKLGYRDDGIEWHCVRDRPALTRRIRLGRADWQAARTVPVQVHDLPPCLPLFVGPAAS